MHPHEEDHQAETAEAEGEEGLKRHASEVIVGVALGLLTDILTDVANAKLKRRFAGR